MRYKQDGGVISSSVPMSQVREREQNRMFGLFRGQVIRAIYPEDPENANKGRMEYVVRVGGQDYPNAVSMKELGGIYQQQETIYKGVEKSETGEINTAQYPENLDGEMVYVMFIEGHGNVPLIIGCAEHPRADKEFKKEDGLLDYKQFNGVEFSVDKDSNYLVKQTGKKNPEGEVEDEAGKDAFIRLAGNGDIELSAYGPDEEPDALRMKFIKEEKKMEFFAQENVVVYDEAGVSIKDKNNNQFNFSASGMSMVSVDQASIEAPGDASINAGGNANIEAGGNANIEAGGDVSVEGGGSGSFKGSGGTDVGDGGSATNVDGSVVNLGGGGAPNARLGDSALGIGVFGVPVSSTIITGSGKVTSA